jgi:hypothetical protein
MIFFIRKWLNDHKELLPTSDTYIERVQTFELLGIHMSNKLSCDVHVEYMLKKVSQRMYCIHCLTRIGANASDIMSVYCMFNYSIDS